MGIGQHYKITVETDKTEKRAVKVSRNYAAQPNTMAFTPGVYCLRTKSMEAKTLWRTCVMLTDLELPVAEE